MDIHLSIPELEVDLRYARKNLCSPEEAERWFTALRGAVRLEAAQQMRLVVGSADEKDPAAEERKQELRLVR